MALTLLQQYELAFEGNGLNLRKRIEASSIRYANYLTGLTIADAPFAGNAVVYNKVMSFCRRVLLSRANSDAGIYLSITQSWIASANNDLVYENLETLITDYLIDHHLEQNVFMRLAGVTGEEFANPV